MIPYLFMKGKTDEEIKKCSRQISCAKNHFKDRAKPEMFSNTGVKNIYRKRWQTAHL